MAIFISCAAYALGKPDLPGNQIYIIPRQSECLCWPAACVQHDHRQYIVTAALLFSARSVCAVCLESFQKFVDIFVAGKGFPPLYRLLRLGFVCPYSLGTVWHRYIHHLRCFKQRAPEAYETLHSKLGMVLGIVRNTFHHVGGLDILDLNVAILSYPGIVIMIMPDDCFLCVSKQFGSTLVDFSHSRAVNNQCASCSLLQGFVPDQLCRRHCSRLCRIVSNPDVFGKLGVADADLNPQVFPVFRLKNVAFFFHCDKIKPSFLLVSGRIPESWSSGDSGFF